MADWCVCVCVCVCVCEFLCNICVCVREGHGRKEGKREEEGNRDRDGKHVCWLRVSTEVMKTSCPKNKLGWKWFIQRILPHCSSSSKQDRTATQTGQDPGGRSWCRDQGGVLLTGLLLLICSACFLIESGPTPQGWHCLSWDLINHELRKCLAAR